MRSLAAPYPARTLAALLLGLVLAIAWLNFLGRNYVFELGDAALGKLTSGVFGTMTGNIHCLGDDTAPCDAAYRQAGSPPAVLWLGNSQLHGVNQYRPGEKTAPMLLHEALEASGRHLLAYSLPGATVHEHAILFERASTMLHLETLILPVVFQSLRASPVRAEIRNVMREPATLAAIAPSPLSASLMPFLEVTTDAIAGPEKSLPERVEDQLDARLAASWPVWGQREQLQGLHNYVFHRLRHLALGINSQTKRPVIDAGYGDKLGVVDGILESARMKGVKVLVYIPPYRQDIPGPYIDAEYSRFKRDIEALARKNGALFAILDDIVPGRDWGMLRDYVLGTDDYDFAHFSAAGHQLLFGAVQQALGELSR